MTAQAGEALDQLLKGIATDHVETVRDAWRRLLRQREDAVVAVRGKLASPVWKDNPRGPLARYFGVLLALLDELEPTVFRDEVERLAATKLHPAHRMTLKVLAQRANDMPVMRLDGDVPIYVADGVADLAGVAATIARWSRTKGLTLEHVTRIDVIPPQSGLDYLGTYNLFYSGIVLIWPAVSDLRILTWLDQLNAEFTFYHEVGHHALGHLEGGQVPQQEREADAYAAKMMRKSRPVLMFFALLFIGPVIALRRWRSTWRKRFGGDMP